MTSTTDSAPGGAWARPACAPTYCSVLAIRDGAVCTACRGRFPLAEGVDIQVNPPAAVRCGGCCRARLESSLAELATTFAELSERVLQGIAATQAATRVLIDLRIAESSVDVAPIAAAFVDEAEWMDADGSER